MKITVDTNVLLRDAIRDDTRQASVAAQTMRRAEQIVIPIGVLCEFAWVLRSSYRISGVDIIDAIQKLVATHNVVVNKTAVEAGLSVMSAGGDFADGALAFEGRQLGADRFATFDVKAASLLNNQGIPATLLA